MSIPGLFPEPGSSVAPTSRKRAKSKKSSKHNNAGQRQASVNDDDESHDNKADARRRTTPPSSSEMSLAWRSILRRLQSRYVDIVVYDSRVQTAVGLAIIAWIAWWLISPSADQRAAQIYSRIWQELQVKRTQNATAAEWQEFQAESEQQVASVLEDLADAADADSPASLSLLWAGNDLLKLIKARGNAGHHVETRYLNRVSGAQILLTGNSSQMPQPPDPTLNALPANSPPGATANDVTGEAGALEAAGDGDESTSSSRDPVLIESPRNNGGTRTKLRDPVLVP